jgi:hypothetical protein
VTTRLDAGHELGERRAQRRGVVLLEPAQAIEHVAGRAPDAPAVLQDDGAGQQPGEDPGAARGAAGGLGAGHVRRLALVHVGPELLLRRQRHADELVRLGQRRQGRREIAPRHRREEQLVHRVVVAVVGRGRARRDTGDRRVVQRQCSAEL